MAPWVCQDTDPSNSSKTSLTFRRLACSCTLSFIILLSSPFRSLLALSFSVKIHRLFMPGRHLCKSSGGLRSILILFQIRVVNAFISGTQQRRGTIMVSPRDKKLKELMRNAEKAASPDATAQSMLEGNDLERRDSRLSGSPV